MGGKKSDALAVMGLLIAQAAGEDAAGKPLPKNAISRMGKRNTKTPKEKKVKKRRAANKRAKAARKKNRK